MPAPKIVSNKQSELSQLLLRYLPFWPYFLISLISSGILAELYLHYKAPVYEIFASILIKNDETQGNNSSFLSPMDIFSSKKIVENEIGILQSHTLINEVVKKLDLYAPVYLDGTLHNKSGYILSPVMVQVKHLDRIKSSKKTKKIYFTYDGTKAVIEGINFPLNTWVYSPWGEIRFIPNPRYVITAYTKKEPLFFTLQSVNQIASEIIKNLDVESSSKLSTIININYKDPVPERGKDILNSLIYFYNTAALKDKNKLAANAVSFLDKRLQRVANGLDSIEVALQLYKSHKNGVDLDEQSRLILGNVSANEEKISELNVQLSTLQQIKSHVQNSVGKPGIIPIESNGNDKVLSGYLGNLYDAELQYDKLRKTTAQNNPLLLSLKDQIDKIKPTILQYVDNKINTLKAAKDNLGTTSVQYTTALRNIPQKQRELLEISRQQVIKSDLYDFLLKKREEAALSYATTISDTRVVDHAVVKPESISRKKRSVVLGLAFILGLCFPIVIFKFKEKILAKDDISDILPYPILGKISYVTSKKTPLIASNLKNFITEQFRQIRTSLEPALGIDSIKNKILVTSSISGEGKSFIISNMAINLALMGKKVILIDLDLHKPKLAEIFEEEGEIGIVDFLLGNANMEEIAYKTEVHENLFLIPARKQFNEPSELLLNGKLSELLLYLEGLYDYILLETSPVNVITDGYIVSKLCDATLFVIRYGFTPKSEIIDLKENAPSRALKNPGIIFNGVKSIGIKWYGKKYYGYAKKKRKKQKTLV